MEIEKNKRSSKCWMCSKKTGKYRINYGGRMYHLICFHKDNESNLKRRKEWRKKLMRRKKYMMPESL